MHRWLVTLVTALVGAWIALKMKAQSARAYVTIALYQYAYRRIRPTTKCHIVGAWYQNRPDIDLTAVVKYLSADTHRPTPIMTLRTIAKYDNYIAAETQICVIVARGDPVTGAVSLHRSIIDLRQCVEVTTRQDVNEIDAETLPGVALVTA